MTGTRSGSYWEATARPGADTPRLQQDLDIEVAIIGGGFTGLSAARELLSAGVSCVVLEAHTIGWGASGRNAGSIVPRYKKPFALLAKKLGPERVRELHGIVLDAAERIPASIDELGIECGYRRCGQMTVAHAPAGMAMLEEEVRWLADVAGDRQVAMLDAAAVRDSLATDVYLGGCFEPRGAAFHPLNYVRGLAAALQARGVPIHSDTAAMRLRHEQGGIRVETTGGSVRARHVLVATNGHTPPGLPGKPDRRVVPVASSILVTEPLAARGVSANPGRRQFIDTRRLVNYGTLLDDGRLLFGGRGDITGRMDSAVAFAALEAGLHQMFPQLKGIGIDYRWSGLVAMTLDDFPHIAPLGERILFAAGYGGRGVVLSQLLGQAAARMLLGKQGDLRPMVETPLPVIPLHGARIPMMRVAARWLQFRDAIDGRASRRHASSAPIQPTGTRQ